MDNPNKIELEKELKQHLEERKHKIRLLTEEFLTIEYDVQHKWICADWRANQTEITVKEGCSLLLELVKEFEVEKVLNDSSTITGNRTILANWIGTRCFPQMKTTGVKYVAWVYGQSGLSQVAIEEALDDIPGCDIVKSFYSLEEAKSWLKNNY